VNKLDNHSCLDCSTEDSGLLLPRRPFIKGAGGAAGLSLFGSIKYLMAEAAGKEGALAEHVVLIWLVGGAPHIDTLDPKTDSKTGGPFKSIKTTVSGIEICEHLPKVARQMKDIAIIRGMSSAEGNHDRARYLMHTGYAPSGSAQHPSFGAHISAELADPSQELPAFVSIQTPSLGGGFLGARHSPFFVNNPTQPIQNVSYPKGVSTPRYDQRIKMLEYMESRFSKSRLREEIDSHWEVYRKAVTLVKSPKVKAFDVKLENSSVRQKYGENSFGQGCLMARRLIEHGVKFVEVGQGGWDTHQNNFDRSKALMGTLDPAVAALLEDLRDRQLLSKTMVIVMGEFGRTPRINGDEGRDHYPRAWSLAMAGGGVKGGQLIGKTDNTGSEVVDGKVVPSDFFQSLCFALGIDPNKQNYSGRGRPIKIVKDGEVIPGLFG